MYSYKVLSSVFLWIINYSIYEGGMQPGQTSLFRFFVLFRQAAAHCVTARFAKTVEKSGNAWYNELKRAG